MTKYFKHLALLKSGYYIRIAYNYRKVELTLNANELWVSLISTVYIDTTACMWLGSVDACTSTYICDESDILKYVIIFTQVLCQLNY